MMATARARRSRRAIRTSRVEDAPDDAGVVAGGCLEGADVAEEQAGGGPASPSPPRSGPQPPRSAVTLFTLHGSPATLVALLGGRRAVPPDPVAELLEEALGAGEDGDLDRALTGSGLVGEIHTRTALPVDGDGSTLTASAGMQMCTSPRPKVRERLMLLGSLMQL
jgi:hypothetical protein